MYAVGCAFLFASIASARTFSIRPSQAIGVTGHLLCNDHPARNVLIKLYDHDTFTLDDLMAKGRSDSHGYFHIEGHAHEISRVTPKLNIYHDCDDMWPCQRKLSIYVPKHFITSGRHAHHYYDIGVIELAGEFEGESRDCFH
ncbi:TTR-8 protein [Aphelenchoides avenae]|nr:TTR-8 protein [Aphelenchus avenae]